MSVPYTVCEQLQVILASFIDATALVAPTSFFYIPYLGLGFADCYATGDLT